MRTILLLIIVGSGACHATDSSVQPYEFYAQTIDVGPGLVWFTYRNTSHRAQCIRPSDLALQIYSDSIQVNDERGNAISYKGPIGPGYGMRTPKTFIVLPPGEKTVGAVILGKFYELRSSTITVRYEVPVIPCESLMSGYIDMPETFELKQTSTSDTSARLVNLRSRFPRWEREGFIAVSQLLTISRK